MTGPSAPAFGDASAIVAGACALRDPSAAAAGSTALQGLSHIYSGGFSTNLRDVASGTNGTCGTDCTAGTGYDLVTGLGSPVNYP